LAEPTKARHIENNKTSQQPGFNGIKSNTDYLLKSQLQGKSLAPHKPTIDARNGIPKPRSPRKYRLDQGSRVAAKQFLGAFSQ
jgi:hypothetical protein